MSINFNPLPTPQEMQDWDMTAINMGIPEFTLMENAAREALYVLKKLRGPLKGQYILIFMGGGNNGGDAAALARHLNDLQAYPLILHTKNLKDYAKTSAQHIQLAKASNVPLVKIPKNGDIQLKKLVPKQWYRPSIVIDGLLGTGFSGFLRPPLQKTITLINKLARQGFVLSLDIPSGCNAMTGQVEEVAVKAHATVCFAAAKPGLIFAKKHTGALYVRKIGIPRSIIEERPTFFRLISAKFIAEAMPPLTPNSHKNTWGHVLVIGGSKGLSGAAHLAARAALRSGVGLVTVAAPSKLCYEIQADTPDIMTMALEDAAGDGYTWPCKLPQNLQNKLTQTSSLALGPGFGTSKDAINFLHEILQYPARPRAVIDADALNILAKHPDMLKFIQDDDILTPHPGEAARLLGISSKDVQKNRVQVMQQLTALAPCVWILKGANALLAKGAGGIAVLPHDIPNLAVAGSGDVLSGCAAAWSARMPTLDAFSVAAMAMTIHAYTGYMAQEIFPRRGNMASDLVEFLPAAMANIANFPDGYNDKL